MNKEPNKEQSSSEKFDIFESFLKPFDAIVDIGTDTVMAIGGKIYDALGVTIDYASERFDGLMNSILKEEGGAKTPSSPPSPQPA
jgi:hypothetical protein